MSHHRSHSALATALGAVAILFWSCSVGVSGSLSRKLGAMAAGAAIYLVGGGAGVLFVLANARARQAMRGWSARYLIICGGLVVLYLLLLFGALALARSERQIMEVGIINYLWPALAVTLGLPVLRLRARFWLAPGLLITLVGTGFAALQQDALGWQQFLDGLRSNWAPYGLMAAGAALWALYSNLARRWAAEGEGVTIPFFFVAAGAIFALISIQTGGWGGWSLRLLPELLFAALFPSLLGYSFWDLAMRKGNYILVASLSYLLPIFSTFASSLFLGTPVRWNLWVGAALVAVGAVICNRSVREPEAIPAAETVAAKGQ